MKKILYISAFLLIFTLSASAFSVNIILNDGNVQTGSFIGKDADAVYIKDKKGGALTIPFTRIKKIFNASTGEEIKKESAPPASPEKSPDNAVKAKEIKIESSDYKIIEKGEYKKKMNLLKRSKPEYIMMDFDLAYLENAWLSDRLKNKYGFSTMLLSAGMSFSALIRPFDFFAAGGYMNFEVWFSPITTQSGTIIDLPSYSSGAVIRFIPYSKDISFGPEDMAFFDLRLGSRKTQNLFDSASLPEGTFVTDIPEIVIIVGTQMDTFALKAGYRFCAADITIPGTSQTVEMDLSGFFISIGIIPSF